MQWKLVIVSLFVALVNVDCLLSNDNRPLHCASVSQDLLRTLPNNLCFSSSNSTGISRLRRVLRALAWLYVDVGYCQGMGLVSTGHVANT